MADAGILARAPTRIDLAGGTLDIWPLSVLTEGALTVNLAIDLRAEAWARRRRDGRLVLVSEDLGRRAEIDPARPVRRGGPLVLLERLARSLAPPGGVELRTRASVPAGSGLGGSSSLAVATAAALGRLAGRRPSAPRLLALVRDHETRVLGSPAGVQDYVAAIHGGLSVVHLEPGGERREGLALAADEIESRLVLFYCGRSRFSGAGNWAVVRARVDGDRATARRLERVARAARALAGALAAGDWRAAAAAMRDEWAARRKLTPEVVAGGMERVVALGRRHGALAGKVCGAGGGGCLVFLTQPRRREQVAAALEAAGLQRLPLGVARRGVRTRVSRRPRERAR